jgi:hypothetical protein
LSAGRSLINRHHLEKDGQEDHGSAHLACRDDLPGPWLRRARIPEQATLDLTERLREQPKAKGNHCLVKEGAVGGLLWYFAQNTHNEDRPRNNSQEYSHSGKIMQA